jgi:hypothetical protein
LFGQLYKHAYQYWTDWLNYQSGKRVPLDKRLPDALITGMGVTRNMSFLGTLGGNLSSVLVQPWAIRNTIAETGLYAAKGAVANLNPSFRSFADKNSRILMGRSFEVLPSGNMMAEKGTKLLTWGLEKFDYETTRVGWLAGYFKGYDKGLRGKDLLNYADDIALIANMSSGKADRPPINRSRFFTAIFQFQTFVYGEWAQLKDIVRGTIKPVNPAVKNIITDAWKQNRWDNAWRYANYLIGSMILYEIYDKLGLPNPIEGGSLWGFEKPGKKGTVFDWSKYIGANAMLSSTPFISTARYGGAPPQKLATAVLNAAMSSPNQRKKAIGDLQSAAARMVPGGGQAFKTLSGLPLAQKGYAKFGGRYYKLDEADKIRALTLGPKQTKAYERYREKLMRRKVR